MMRPLTLAELVGPLQAQLIGPDQAFSGVATDSRKVRPGELFVALRGEHFDGHDYVSAVAAQGAAAAMVDKAWAAANPVPLPLLVVDDTRRGLGQLAANWRSRFSTLSRR